MDIRQSRGFPKFRSRRKGRIHYVGLPRVSRPLLPPIQRTSLRYIDYWGFGSKAALDLTNSLTYGVNALYDPYLGLGGHQPFEFDQWAALYRYYFVIASQTRLIVEAENSNGDMTNVSMAHLPYSQTGYVFTAQEIVESPLWETKVMTGNIGNSNSRAILSRYWDLNCEPMHRSANWADELEIDSAGTNSPWTALVTANPAANAAYVFIVWSPIAASPVTRLTFEIEFDVVFFNPKDIATSEP